VRLEKQKGQVLGRSKAAGTSFQGRRNDWKAAPFAQDPLINKNSVPLCLCVQDSFFTFHLSLFTSYPVRRVSANSFLRVRVRGNKTIRQPSVAEDWRMSK